MKRNKKRRQEHSKSISTPLGHIKVNSEVAEEPITEQIRELLDEDEK